MCQVWIRRRLLAIDIRIASFRMLGSRESSVMGGTGVVASPPGSAGDGHRQRRGEAARGVAADGEQWRQVAAGSAGDPA